MAHEVLMPKLSSTMDTGKITEWYKKEGDYIEVGDVLFEVMTDKIAIEVESYDEGILLKRYIEVNDECPVNSVIAYIGEKDEVVPETIEYESTTDEAVEESTAPATEEVEPMTSSKGVRATPSARRLAKERNINLQEVNGTGRSGRIQKIDIENFRTIPSISQVNEVEVIPWSGMRKVIADRMVQSVQTSPHVSMHAPINVSKLIEIKDSIDEKITITDLFIYFISRILPKYKILNANTQEDGIYTYSNVNMGLAVALENGLIVPVIHNVNHMKLGEIANTTKQLAQKAKENNLTPQEMQGGTITISALGKTVVREFNPIINQPEVAIIGVGGMYVENNIPTITVSLSFDHRVVDGYPVTQFLNELAQVIENPYKLF